MTSGDIVTKHNKKSNVVVLGFTDTFTVHLDPGSIDAQVACMLIDLSDATNWPHTKTGSIILEYVILEVDPDASYLGEVKVGFLANVDASNGDFKQILDIDMRKKSDLLVEVINFGSHGIDCETDHIFGPTLADSELFQTDVGIVGPDGNSYNSGDGDLALLVEVAAGTVDVSITLGYETVE